MYEAQRRELGITQADYQTNSGFADGLYASARFFTVVIPSKFDSNMAP